MLENGSLSITRKPGEKSTTIITDSNGHEMFVTVVRTACNGQVVLNFQFPKEWKILRQEKTL